MKGSNGIQYYWLLQVSWKREFTVLWCVRSVRPSIILLGREVIHFFEALSVGTGEKRRYLQGREGMPLIVGPSMTRKEK